MINGSCRLIIPKPDLCEPCRTPLILLQLLFLSQQLLNWIGKHGEVLGKGSGSSWTRSQHRAAPRCPHRRQQGSPAETTRFRASLEAGSKAMEVHRSPPADSSWPWVSFRHISGRALEKLISSHNPKHWVWLKKSQALAPHGETTAGAAGVPAPLGHSLC